MREQPHRLVFVDETFINTKMTRLRGRSRKGDAYARALPLATGKRTPSSPGCAVMS